jgi:hypothetical protein
MLLPRWYYVEKYAVALPFWDQWDAEGDWLLRPWIDGTFHISDLWHPQNEHWLVPSHILTLVCYELTGTWSNLTEARVNIFLGVLTPLLLIRHLYKRNEIFGWRYLLIPLLAASVALPFAWENMLFGFQSQFYFLCFFTLSTLLLASRYPYVPMAIIGIVALCVLSIATMASGLLTPLVAAGIYVLHFWMLPVKRFKAMLVISILLLLVILAYFIMPYNAGHDMLHAQNGKEFILAFIRHVGWPLRARKLFIGLIWLPGAIILFRFAILRRLTNTDILMAGCFIWSTLQAAAMAYGRGHELGEVISRYTDLLTLGLAGNAWFVLRWIETTDLKPKWRYLPACLAIFFFAVLFLSLIQRFTAGINSMRRSYESRSLQQRNVGQYLRTGDNVHLQHGNIPYPDPVRLQQLLDNPALRKALASVDDSEAKKK